MTELLRAPLPPDFTAGALAEIEDGMCMMIFHRSRERCAELAQYKIGYRCANGCWGEGEFERMCEDHLPDYKIVMMTDPSCIACNRCNHTNVVEFFQIQEI